MLNISILLMILANFYLMNGLKMMKQKVIKRSMVLFNIGRKHKNMDFKLASREFPAFLYDYFKSYYFDIMF
jgi:hypothetical protein